MILAPDLLAFVPSFVSPFYGRGILLLDVVVGAFVDVGVLKEAIDV